MNYNIVTYILESDISYDLTSIHGSYISIRETSMANIKKKLYADPKQCSIVISTKC